MSTPRVGYRTVIGNIALSLDGRVSGAGGESDMSWIVPHATSDGARQHLARLTSSATTVLLGRKNYEGFHGYWPSVAQDESADPRDRAIARWLNEVEKVVFSATLKDPRWRNSRVVDADPAGVVSELRQRDGGDIAVLASSSVIRNLLGADALDRLSITLCPEIVGVGAQLFEDGLPASSWRPAADAIITDTGAICLCYDRIRA